MLLSEVGVGHPPRCTHHAAAKQGVSVRPNEGQSPVSENECGPATPCSLQRPPTPHPQLTCHADVERRGPKVAQQRLCDKAEEEMCVLMSSLSCQQPP